jgi:hypothetical protein
MPGMNSHSLAVALTLAGVAWSSGCATTRPGARIEPAPSAASFSYGAGRGIQDFAVKPAAARTAVFEAMDDLKMTVIHRGPDGPVTQSDGRTSDGRTVTITIRPQRSETRVSCRIGWFGDQALSRTVLERVGIRLGTLPPAPIPDEPPSTPAPNPIFSREAIPDAVILRDFAEAPYRERVDP